MKKSSHTLKIIFKDINKEQIDVNYDIVDTKLAQAWANKIKHLKNIPFDPVESNLVDHSDLLGIYQEFCSLAGLEAVNFTDLTQKQFNILHSIYEQHHDRLSRVRHNEILYKFHHAIHHAEQSRRGATETHKITVGWGVKEGMLTDALQCNQYYEGKLRKNCLYLPWSELGKKPLCYWRDKEPDNQERFNQLAKPHMTFRANFFVATADVEPEPLPIEFSEWFDQYKDAWLNKYHLKDWTNVDEHSAPLLAITDHKQSLTNHTIHKIIYENN